MLARLASSALLMLTEGPRVVVLAREAKRRGAVQKKAELRPFISSLRRRRLRTVVEIGTYRGGTLWLWCRLARRDALIISIDMPGGEFGGGYDRADADRIRAYARARQQVVLLQGDSHAPSTLAELAAALRDRQVDLLFIDGDHTYDGVKRDYEMYSPFVRPGGWIAFHDILPHSKDPRCEVDRFWRELKPYEAATEEFVDPGTDPHHTWGGIGAVTAQ